MPQITLNSETEIIACVTTPDGRIEVVEETTFWTGPTVGQGEKFINPSPRKTRHIEPGDDVSNEPEWVKDMVNGNLHTPARVAARQAAQQAQQNNP